MLPIRRLVISLTLGTVSLLAGCSASGGEGTAPVEVGISPGSRLLDLSEEDLAAQLSDASELGAQWLRVDLDWSRIEPNRGERTWQTTDQILVMAAEEDLQVVLLVTYTPAWVRPPATSEKHPPTDLAAYRDFVTEAVQRYGPQVAAWEIWNEPNTPAFWEPAADPAAYVELFDTAATAIRSIDREAVVLTGGLAPAVDEGGEMSAETFLAEMYRTLTPGRADGVAIHPYSFPAMPSNDADWNLFSRLDGIAQLVAQSEGRSLPLWLTEYGAPTGTSERAVDPSLQAEMITEALRCVAASDLVGPIFLYNLHDPVNGSRDDPEDNFGLVDSSGRPKPAFGSVQEELSGGVESSGACGL